MLENKIIRLAVSTKVINMTIPNKSLVEIDLPIEDLHELALREGNSKKPIYQIHKWWARRLGTVFRSLIIASKLPSTASLEDFWHHFYSKNNFSDTLVLDPFMGGGTSIVEARKCNARVIGVDIDPIAWFVTKNEIQNFDERHYFKMLQQLEDHVGEKIRSYYVTLHNGEPTDVIYYFWVDRYTCPSCNEEFDAHPHFKIARNKKNLFAVCSKCDCLNIVARDSESFQCTECSKTTTILNGPVNRGYYRCPKCEHGGKLLDLILPGKPPKKKLFAVEYIIPNTGERAYKKADKFDLDLYNDVSEKFRDQEANLLFPRNKIFTEGRNDARPINYGYEYYYQLFNKRQLLSLSLIYSEIIKVENLDTRDYLLTAFSDSLTSNNLLCSYAFDYQKLTPLFGIHAFNVISRPVENNVWGTQRGRGTFTKCARKLSKGKQYAQKPFEFEYLDGKARHVYTGEQILSSVSNSIDTWYNDKPDALLLNQSSEDLSLLRNNTVDIILTDPPYFDNLSYSELSDFFYAWIKDQLPEEKGWKATTPYQEALFANPGDKIGLFENGIENVFGECQRILKLDGIMLFTFHHRKLSAWKSIYSALSSTDLVITNILPMRSEGRGAFHSSEGNIKWDSVIVCRHGRKKDGQYCHIDILWDFVDAHLNHWLNRLSDTQFRFNWADATSFGISLGIQKLSEYQINLDRSFILLEELESRLMAKLASTTLHES